MEKSYELKYHNFEEKYWWFEARRDIILKLIDKENKNSKILEIGCSGGPLIKFLKNHGFKNLYGIDLSKDAIELCKKRGINNVFVMDGKKIEFDDQSFDIIIASDVLEHIEDDFSALLEWNRILKKEGKLLLFVPAFNFLFGEHDKINKHYRRYSKFMLSNVVKKSNFKILKNSYWNFLLFFPVATTRIFQSFLLNKRKNTKDQLLSLNPSLNKFLIYLLKFENIFLKKFNFPVGVSVFIVGIKN